MNVGVKVATAAAGVLTLALLLYKWSVRSSQVPPSAASGGGQSEGKQQVLVEEDMQQMVVVEEDKQQMVVEEVCMISSILEWLWQRFPIKA